MGCTNTRQKSKPSSNKPNINIQDVNLQITSILQEKTIKQQQIITDLTISKSSYQSLQSKGILLPRGFYNINKNKKISFNPVIQLMNQKDESDQITDSVVGICDL